jgi:uncharacterized membrane protein YkoI
MMTKTLLLLGTLLATAVFMASNSGCADKKSGQDRLLSQAKISQAQAQSIALAQVLGGVIESGELKQEQGRLIWSFDISMPDSTGVIKDTLDSITGGSSDISASDSITEVAVNAVNGKVISVEKNYSE